MQDGKRTEKPTARDLFYNGFLSPTPTPPPQSPARAASADEPPRSGEGEDAEGSGGSSGRDSPPPLTCTVFASQSRARLSGSTATVHAAASAAAASPPDAQRTEAGKDDVEEEEEEEEFIRALDSVSRSASAPPPDDASPPPHPPPPPPQQHDVAGRSCEADVNEADAAAAHTPAAMLHETGRRRNADYTERWERLVNELAGPLAAAPGAAAAPVPDVHADGCVNTAGGGGPGLRLRYDSAFYCPYCTYTVCGPCYASLAAALAVPTASAARPAAPGGERRPGAAEAEGDISDVLFTPMGKYAGHRPARRDGATDVAGGCTRRAAHSHEERARRRWAGDTRPLRCPLCGRADLAFESVLLCEWRCEGLAPSARLARAPAAPHALRIRPGALFDGDVIQRYYTLRARRRERRGSAQPMRAFFLGEEDAAEGSPALRTHGRHACREGGAFRYSVHNPRDTEECVWCGVALAGGGAAAASDFQHPAYKGYTTMGGGGDAREATVLAVVPLRAHIAPPTFAPVTASACSAAKGGTAAVPRAPHAADAPPLPVLRCRVPHGTSARFQALALYSRRDLFARAHTELSGGADPERAQHLSAVVVSPNARVRPLLVVYVRAATAAPAGKRPRDDAAADDDAAGSTGAAAAAARQRALLADLLLGGAHVGVYGAGAHYVFLKYLLPSASGVGVGAAADAALARHFGGGAVVLDTAASAAAADPGLVRRQLRRALALLGPGHAGATPPAAAAAATVVDVDGGESSGSEEEEELCRVGGGDGGGGAGAQWCVLAPPGTSRRAARPVFASPELRREALRRVRALTLVRASRPAPSPTPQAAPRRRLLLVAPCLDRAAPADVDRVVGAVRAARRRHGPVVQLLFSFESPVFASAPLRAALAGCRLLHLPADPAHPAPAPPHKLQRHGRGEDYRVAHNPSVELLLAYENANLGGGGGRPGGGGGALSLPLHDTLKRILYSLPPIFVELLELMIECQERQAAAASPVTGALSVFVFKHYLEAKGRMLSEARLKSLLKELTSNRIAVLHAGEYTLSIPQPERVRRVIAEVRTERQAAAAASTTTSAPPAAPSLTSI